MTSALYNIRHRKNRITQIHSRLLSKKKGAKYQKGRFVLARTSKVVTKGGN